jgi:hypothetical protein
MPACAYCGDILHLEFTNGGSAWVDQTEGDGCSGNDELENENGTHRPILVGMRVELMDMPDDPYPVPAGSRGTVTGVVDGPLPQIWVDWDCGRTLNMIPGVDHWVLLDDLTS